MANFGDVRWFQADFGDFPSLSSLMMTGKGCAVSPLGDFQGFSDTMGIKSPQSCDITHIIVGIMGGTVCRKVFGRKIGGLEIADPPRT